jgi:acyl carrier protein
MPEESQEIIEYIINDVLRSPGTPINEDTPLVSSGLIDSFALVDILMKVEDVTRLRIPAGKVQPKDMDTVRLMLETAARIGRPRK